MTGVETASGLTTRSSANDPNDGAELRSPRNADTDVRPRPTAENTSAVRTNRRSASGSPAISTLAASRSALAATTRASVLARLVMNGSGLRPVSGSSTWW